MWDGGLSQSDSFPTRRKGSGPNTEPGQQGQLPVTSAIGIEELVRVQYPASGLLAVVCRLRTGPLTHTTEGQV